MNILDVIKKIERDLGNQFALVGLNYIVDRLLDNYRDIYNKHNWDFFLKSIPFRIYKYYNTYCVLGGEKDSTQLEVESRPDYYLEYDRLWTTYDLFPYEILSWNDGALGYVITLRQTLMESIVHRSEDGNAIYLYKQDYALPSDCSFNKEIALLDTVQGVCLKKVSEPTFTLAIAGDYFRVGEPVVYMTKSKDRITDANNYNYITIYPFICSADRYLQLWYYRKPFGNFNDYDVTIGSDDYFILEIPDEFYHYLYWATLESCYYRLGDARMGYALQKKVEIFRDLKARNDGDRAMQRIISEYPSSMADITDEDGIFSVRITNG